MIAALPTYRLPITGETGLRAVSHRTERGYCIGFEIHVTPVSLTAHRGANVVAELRSLPQTCDNPAKEREKQSP